MNTESTEQTQSGAYAGPPPLVRPRDGRMLTGTALAIAHHFGLDVTIVRVVFVVLALCGGAGVPLYLAAFLLIPEEGAEQSIAAEVAGSLGWR